MNEITPLFAGKKIFLALPDNNGFDKLICSQLESLGFTVTLCVDKYWTKFKYQTIWHRLYNVYRKVIHQDYAHKRKLIQEFRERTLMADLPEIFDHYDFALFIRPDAFPVELIKILRDRSKILSAYQWDGMARYPVSEDRIALFDRFFVFDPEDVTERLLPLTNFHIKHRDSACDVGQVSEPLKAFFLGGFDQPRFEQLQKMKSSLVNHGYKADFTLYTKSGTQKKKILKENIQHIDQTISYLDTLTTVKKADLLIDLIVQEHKGLSFRIFEALGFKKKLITSNATVKDYDFYYPENIYVWDEKNKDGLEVFLTTPMREIPRNVFEKYGFENWIKYVLGVDGNLPITLPR